MNDLNDITISTAEKKDMEKIYLIAVNAWKEIHKGYRKVINDDDLYSRISKDWEQKKIISLQKKFEQDPDRILIAKDIDNNILGFISFSIDYETSIAEIGNNAVDPKYQGKGIGKYLYKYVLNILKNDNFKYVTVTTGYEDPGHSKARASYEKVGFKKMRTSITYSLKL